MVRFAQISQNILTPIPRKYTNPSHPLYPSENLTTQYDVKHEENNVGMQIIHTVETFLYFFNSLEAETTE